MDIQKFIELNESKDSIIEKLKYLKKNGLNDYFAFALSEMNLKKLPNKNEDQIVQQIIPKTPLDLNKKIKNPLYYHAHLCCIKYAFEDMFLHDDFIKNLENHNVEKGKDMVVYNYYNLLQEILFDMAFLIQDYNQEINNKSSLKTVVSKHFNQSEFTLYKLLPQIIFGQVTFHSFIDREPFVSITIIRQIIELKVRRTFGIFGAFDKENGVFEPLGLGIILEEIKKHKIEIDFAVPLENIIRINGWANIYLHSGTKDYTWTLIFVYRYLHQLINGREDGKTRGINSGIKLKQETLDKIIIGLETTLKASNKKIEIFKSQPGAFIIS
jgi:hypothetical protein